MFDFDDSALEDADVLARHDEYLRHLAGTGARIRIEAAEASNPGVGVLRPRGIVAVGPEARLIRAVLEPISRVPFVAWPFGGLPAWVGPLDLVLVLASGVPDAELLTSVLEARRRGAMLIVAAEASSEVAEAAGTAATLLLGTRTGDPLASAIGVLAVLHQAELGPEVHPATAADAADLVAEASSPHVDLSNNPAKALALGLAESEPLIWGGSVLAGRASRRIAEAVRRSCGRAALAGDASELLVLISATPLRDTFADPFDELGSDRRPTLLMLDDRDPDAEIARQSQVLAQTAEAHGVRVCTIASDEATGSNAIDRYVSLMLQGLYGAAYLAIGLGRRP